MTGLKTGLVIEGGLILLAIGSWRLFHRLDGKRDHAWFYGSLTVILAVFCFLAIVLALAAPGYMMEVFG